MANRYNKKLSKLYPPHVLEIFSWIVRTCITARIEYTTTFHPENDETRKNPWHIFVEDHRLFNLGNGDYTVATIKVEVRGPTLTSAMEEARDEVNRQRIENGQPTFEQASNLFEGEAFSEDQE